MAASVPKHVQIAEMGTFSACNLIDTLEATLDLADSFYNLPEEVPALCVNLEGENLCWDGTVSILRSSVLATSTYHQTLQSVLESSETMKVFLDVRNDSDALFAHFGIKLDGVQDLQLMEFASREARKSFLCGLATTVKDTGRKLFDPPSGGSYAIFDKRPLLRKITMYCIQDVQCLPQLWLVYNQKLTPHCRLQVGRESQARMKLSQSTDFNGQGRHMALPLAG
ncbi:hypothetical protein LY76DRAFT_670626 [Colletotrichum caudatum]|nr:hypothetical protein LY76DRAFT_670626 [Colletotrichum caudatum]